MQGFQFHPSPAIFFLSNGKRWLAPGHRDELPSPDGWGCVQVLTSHQVLLVGGEGVRAAVCLSSPSWLKGWINLQWAVSLGSFLLLLSASASGNEAGIGLFWQVQPTWSLRSVTLIGNNLKVLNCKISYRKGWQFLFFFRVLHSLPEGFSHPCCNKWLTCFWRDAGVSESVLNFPFALCCFFGLKIPPSSKTRILAPLC